MLARLLMAGMMLAACCSCVPARDAGGYRVSIALPDADRRLLEQLALGDPLSTPVTGPALASPLAAAPPFLASLSTDDGRRAQDCLTAAIYYEARSEPVDGQRAVAQVVLNRVRDRAFPASVCGVVYQHSARVCQFTFACDGSTGHPIEPRAWALASALAAAALDGSVYAPIGAATHYHTNAILPWWASSLARVGEVGSHIFYRWRSGLADALSFRQTYAGHESVGDTAGVTIASGGADQHGVTIHRGSGADGEVGIPALPAPAPPAGIAVHTFGVRIHRTAAAEEAIADTPEPEPGDPH